MRSIKSHPKSDLRAYYTVFLELGIVITLLIFIVATKIDLSFEKKEISYADDQEVIKMEEVVKTQHEEMPPPRPQIPVEIPNDEIIEEQEENFLLQLSKCQSWLMD